MKARLSGPAVTRPAPGRLSLTARALLGLTVVIAAAVPALFCTHALTALGGPAFLIWMATWGTPIAYGACTAILAIRLVCRRRDRAVWGCFAGYVLFPIMLMLGVGQAARARGLRFGVVDAFTRIAGEALGLAPAIAA